ncbi:MAG: toll/interleukin-1 receptor domain-containing protein [bacterium]
MPPGNKARVFISHSSRDKEFVRKLVGELEKQSLNVWFDEREIKVGDSIVGKISDGLKDSDYLVVVLSKASVASPWVREELNAALMEDISNKGCAVLPVLIEDCEIPPLLKPRLYADFRKDFDSGLRKLLDVLEQEEEPATDYIAFRGAPPPDPTVFRRFAATPPCTAQLLLVSTADLRRRMTDRMDRSEVGTIWFDVFETKMDDDLQGLPLVSCVIELLVRAKKRNKIFEVIAAVCNERPDLANP